jgi:DNA-binding NarL/FixJ family response regulator
VETQPTTDGARAPVTAGCVHLRCIRPFQSPDAFVPIRILLADDHPSVRQALTALLSTAGDIQIVGESGDAASTREEAMRSTPDVIVLDVHMPGATGMALARELRQRVAGVRILAISLFRDPMIVDAMHEAGALGYVHKDDLHACLIPAIRAVAGGETYASPGLSLPEGRSQHPTDG